MNWIKGEIVSGNSQTSYLFNGVNGDKAVIIICGILSKAADYTDVFADLKEPTFIIESCFYDDYPDLSFNGQVKRITNAIESLSFKKYILVGHSVGGAVATGVAYKNPSIAALVIIDYFPIYPQPDQNWRIKALEQNPGISGAINRFLATSERVDLRKEFSEISIPLHVFKADQSNYLTQEICNKILLLNPNATVTTIEDCDHNLNGDLKKFKTALMSVIESV